MRENTIVSNIADGVTLPTKIVDATAQFLVDRVKQELTLAFFDKFRAKLDSLSELRLMLPHTYTFLKTANYFDVPSLGKAWIEAFKSDLEKLPQDFERLIGERYPEIAQKNEFKLFLITYHTLELLSKGTHPAYIIEYLDANYTQVPIVITDKLSQSLRMLQLLSDNLKVEKNDENKIWVDIDDFKQLKLGGSEYFVGLLYQQEKDNLFKAIEVSGTTTLTSWITNDEARINKFVQNANQLVTFFTMIQTQIDKINNETKTEEKLKKYLAYAQISTDVIDFGFRFRYLFDLKNDYYQSDYYKKWKPIGDNTIATLQAVNDKNYGGILTHGLSLLKPFFEKDLKNDLIEMQNILTSLPPTLVAGNKSDIQKILDKTKQSFEEKITQRLSNDNFEKFVKDFENDLANISTNSAELKDKLSIIQEAVKQRIDKKEILQAFDQLAYFGNFIIDVVSVATDTSKTAKDIKVVINKYAQPVGSYSIKRKSISSIDINAYPGLYAGGEWGIHNTKTPNANANSTSIAFTNGVTAPIGISFNWGLKGCKTKKLRGDSFSLFLSVIDIGAALSFRWSNDSASSLPTNVKWSQILSPGLHAVYGFKNAPISLIAGAQLTPNLRDFKDNQNYANMIRLGVTIAVDIPVFNLRRKEDEN